MSGREPDAVSEVVREVRAARVADEGAVSDL
jgi:hypothetical protein